jgi:predicted nucleic-acid-binding Zn-ribbon protein
MNSNCPKCKGVMHSETHDIPSEIPLPIPLNPKVPIWQYLPDVIRRHKYYTVFVCQSCGYLESFIHD